MIVIGRLFQTESGRSICVVDRQWSDDGTVTFVHLSSGETLPWPIPADSGWIAIADPATDPSEQT